MDTIRTTGKKAWHSVHCVGCAFSCLMLTFFPPDLLSLLLERLRDPLRSLLLRLLLLCPTHGFKGLVAGCHSFCLFFICYNLQLQTFIQSHSFIRRHTPGPLSISSSRGSSVGKNYLCAEPRIELGPALQQADALPIEPRRTTGFYPSIRAADPDPYGSVIIT